MIRWESPCGRNIPGENGRMCSMVRITEPGFNRSVFLLRQKSGEIPPVAERFAQFVEDYMRTLET